MTLLLGMAGSAAAQCGGTQLCAPGAGDCTVNTACTITVPPGGLTIDLGSRRLVLTKTLTVNGPAGGSLLITAGDVLIDGGTIVMPGANGVAGILAILSDTNLTVRGGSVIDVTGSDSAGVVDLEALNGNLSYDGRIRATAIDQRMGYGGEIDLFASGSVSVTGPGLDVSGGDLGGAGFMSIEASTGSINVASPLKAFGADGGDIDLAAGTTIQTTSAAQLNVDANGDAGSAGAIDVSAGGDIVINGETIGSGSLPDFQMDGKSGGDGADFDIVSSTGSITMNGRITANGASGGSGGAIDFDAAQNLTITKPIIVTSGGLDGLGGDVFLTAGGTLSVQQSVDASGSVGSGGSIELLGQGAVTVSNSLLTDGDFFGGTVTVTGCTVNVTGPAILSARGPGLAPMASNTIRASSTMTIAGTLRATSANRLEYRSAPAPAITGPVTPAATLILLPTLPCCVSCPVTTTTTTTTSTTTTRPTTTTTSTTSTTAPSTTSTTAPSTTSTTVSTTTTTTTTTTTLPSVCGNGVVTGAEQCDDGNTANGDCCSSTCTFEAANAPCASDSNACTRDVCNGAGACTHPAGNPGATCRAAAGPCDQAETCSGTSTTCPADAKRTDVCRAAAGACDVAESCDGVANTCPADGFAAATTPCRTAAGVCDRIETCTGTGPACPADQFQSAGTPCRAAASVCDVAETCAGTSVTCPADGFRPNGTQCGGNTCTGSGTCQSGVCTGATPVACGPCESCDPTGGCIAAPLPTCRRPVASGKSTIKIKDSLGGPKGDRVMWKWLPGGATSLGDFGDPVATDGLTLCIFDRSQATSSLLFRAAIAAGGTCGTKPCWTGNGKTFKYTDRAATGDGVAAMSLIPGAAGKAKILLSARGTGLSQRPFGVPMPPLSVPLTVQLQSENGQCWESSFSRTGVKKNTNQTFTAVSD